MLRSVEGVYRNGAIEFLEIPPETREDTYVIVTFLHSSQSGLIDLRARGIDKTQAEDLRGRLSTFATEWDSPEMKQYDNYDRAKSNV